MVAALVALLVAASGEPPPAAPVERAAAESPAAHPAAAEGLGSGRGPALVGPIALSVPRLTGPVDRRWLPGRVLLGAGGGALVGDGVVLGLAYGTFLLFTHGAVAPTAGNFRAAGVGLLAAAVLLPPLGAALGGAWAGHGPRGGGFWRAFLLSTLGHSLALTAGYLTAPTFWAVVPVQLATMAPATAVGLRWGASAPPAPAPLTRVPPRRPAVIRAAGLGAPGCPAG